MYYDRLSSSMAKDPLQLIKDEIKGEVLNELWAMQKYEQAQQRHGAYSTPEGQHDRPFPRLIELPQKSQDAKNQRPGRRNFMKAKPDDRSNNVARIQQNIDNTIRKIETAEEIIAVTDDPTVKKDLREKNERRQEALDGMRAEIKDEARDRK